MSTPKKSPSYIYAPQKPGRQSKYPFAIAAQVTPEQYDFLESECEKLHMRMSEYIRLLVQDAMEMEP